MKETTPHLCIPLFQQESVANAARESEHTRHTSTTAVACVIIDHSAASENLNAYAPEHMQTHTSTLTKNPAELLLTHFTHGVRTRTRSAECAHKNTPSDTNTPDNNNNSTWQTSRRVCAYVCCALHVFYMAGSRVARIKIRAHTFTPRHPP